MAAERLARLRETAASTETFQSSMPSGTQAPAARPANVADPAATTTTRPSVGAGGPPRRRLDAYGQFEAFVLQSFVQSMLPKNATNVFGSGSAGEFWKSMLAEKMGDELARSGQVGIARRLAAGSGHDTRPATTITTSPPAPPPAATPTRSSPARADEVPAADAAMTVDVPTRERS